MSASRFYRRLRATLRFFRWWTQRPSPRKMHPASSAERNPAEWRWRYRQQSSSSQGKTRFDPLSQELFKPADTLFHSKMKLLSRDAFIRSFTRPGQDDIGSAGAPHRSRPVRRAPSQPSRIASPSLFEKAKRESRARFESAP